ncbi:MAG: pilus assembly protein [Lachnospiraceae bacterium]|nr:pilus assembly protein [Lachnospiraceae bacterium]
MNGNRGQTTIFFSLMISVLFLFTLTSLEAGRIYMSRVKVRTAVHSACSNLMADYHSELFERYHLLFLDPTYGTGSEAAVEEKLADYLECDLNVEDGPTIYQFTLDELAAISQDPILEDNMEFLRQQIVEYEKTEGLVHKADGLKAKMQEDNSDVEGAARETEINGVEFPESENTDEEHGKKQSSSEVSDPRDLLTDGLKNGLLAFVLPGDQSISKESYAINDPPSRLYQEQEEKKRDSNFQDILSLKDLLKEAAGEKSYSGLVEQAAFVDYVGSLFGNAVNPDEASVIQCEVEYILKGKDSDYENLQAVVEELTWIRMPVNYAYLLSDTKKKSEALTLAAAICTATGTEPMMEVVKYLLLGCWSYGETIYEMRQLLSGEAIAYVKTQETWNTDLKTLSGTGTTAKVEHGMQYEDYLMLLLAKKSGKHLTCSYARMLDLIGCNLQKEDEDFHIADCVGGMVIQGEISVNPLFQKGRETSVYQTCFEERFS